MCFISNGFLQQQWTMKTIGLVCWLMIACSHNCTGCELGPAGRQKTMKFRKVLLVRADVLTWHLLTFSSPGSLEISYIQYSISSNFFSCPWACSNTNKLKLSLAAQMPTIAAELSLSASTVVFILTFILMVNYTLKSKNLSQSPQLHSHCLKMYFSCLWYLPTQREKGKHLKFT